MGIISYLKEELDSPNMMAGRSNIWFDRAKGGFEVYFKVNGITYSFLAESEGTEYEDGIWKIQLRKKWAGNTENIEDTKEVQAAFVEAMNDWVELKNPTAFYWLASELYPSYNNIANALSKKIKTYNFIDETKETHEDVKFDVIEETPETKYKRFIFTRTEPKEMLDEPELWYEKKLDDNEETFGTYEKVEDIKPNKEFMTIKPAEQIKFPKGMPK